MTPLPIPNLYAVPVPGDSYDIKLDGTIRYKDSLHLAWEADPHPDYEPLHHSLWVSIPEGAELIGTVTASTMNFDAEPFSEKQVWEFGQTATPDGRLHNDLVGAKVTWRRNYAKENTMEAFSAQDSFRSALSAAQIYFQNPLGEEPKPPKLSGQTNTDFDYLMHIGDEYKHELQQWQAAQSKVVQKCVIIKAN